MKHLKQKCGAKGLMITEINADRKKPNYLEDFQKMVQLIQHSNGVTALIHEWKPEMPDDVDYGGGKLAMGENDPRLPVLINAITKELAAKTKLNPNSIAQAKP